MKRIVVLVFIFVYLVGFGLAQAEWLSLHLGRSQMDQNGLLSVYELSREARPFQVASDLFDDWDYMLQVVAEQNQIIIWGLEQIESYSIQPTWKKLCSARIACMIVSEYLGSMKWPQKTLSSDRISDLKNTEIPVEIYELNHDVMDLRSDVYMFRLLYNTLETKWYYKQVISQLLKLSRNYIHYIQANNEYLYLKTNELYLNLFFDSKAAKEKAQKWDSGTCWFDDFTLLKTNEPFLLNQFTNASNAFKTSYEEFQTIISISESVLTLIEIGGLPCLLPYPEWLTLDQVELLYYTRLENGDIIHPKREDTLEHISEYMSVKNISIAQVETWIDYLEPYVDEIIRHNNRWVITVQGYTIHAMWMNDIIRFVFNDQLCTFVTPQLYQFMQRQNTLQSEKDLLNVKIYQQRQRLDSLYQSIHEQINITDIKLQ